ncbi:metalloprotease TIKI1 [Triplophysa rosa]|uniref:metalloprotease TIKI1 n=1 Tax=Triplophysa rosa TaxID=992332 RepID=UPI002545C130|nr:metalloprotease TIKI1 [Triplophysa rosa]
MAGIETSEENDSDELVPKKNSHFLGNNTVIEVLRSQGYEVEHTPAGQPLHRRSSEDLTDSPLEPFLHDTEDHQESVPQRLPHSLELLEKVERKLKKKRRNKQKKPQKHRHFNDLWVRLEESTTAEPPPPLVRIINGYIKTHPQDHGRPNREQMFSGSASSWTSTAFILYVQIALLTLHL